MSQLTQDTLHYYKGRYYTGRDISAMREWIRDCEWPDLDQESIAALSPRQVLNGIEKHVNGGIVEFITNMI